MDYIKLNTLHEILEKTKERFGDFKLDTEMVGIEHALNRFTAEDIIVNEDLPGFDRSNVDGFALISGDTLGENEGTSSIFSQIGQTEAGKECYITIGADECVYVSAGAMLPLNADGVAHIEDCEVIGPMEVSVNGPIERWENVVRKGDDFRKGDILLYRGMRIGAREIAALAGAGCNHINVFRKLHVSVISTGEEVIEPFNSRILPGQVRDMNSYTICAFLKKFGATTMNMGIARDNARGIEEILEKSLSTSDIIVITGGSSDGTRDKTLNIIKRIEGVEIITNKIGIMPGSDTIVAKAGDKMIFGLPGNPVSAMILLETLVKPFILFSNNAHEESMIIKARCLKDYKSRTNKEEYLIVSLDKEEDEYVLVPFTGRTGYVSSMLNADGYIRIRPSDEGIREGQEVEVFLF